jgi:hypothetical protein
VPFGTGGFSPEKGNNIATGRVPVALLYSGLKPPVPELHRNIFSDSNEENDYCQMDSTLSQDFPDKSDKL